MKTPVILRIFGVLNLIVAMIGLILGSSLIIEYLDKAYIWNREIILASYIVICSVWLLFGSLSWFFGFRPAFGLIIISSLSIFSFLVGVLNYAIEVGVSQKIEKQLLTALILGSSVYAIFILSSVLSKPVKDWKIARPEMKKWTLPLLTLFLVMTFGSHLAVEVGRQDPIDGSYDDMSYSETEYAIDSTMAEGDYYEGDYYEGEEEYDDYGYEGDVYQYSAFYNEPYQVSPAYNDQSVYPAPRKGKSFDKKHINKLLIAFFDGFLSNSWDRELLRQTETIDVYTENNEAPVGMYLSGMASIYDRINPYFLRSTTIENYDDCYLACYLEDLTGINPFLSRVDEDNKFNKYNPELIKWMYTNLIPDPTDNFLNDLLAREIYSKVFRRSIRLYTQAYCYVVTHDFQSEIREYKFAASGEEFYGPSYLENRYSSAIQIDSNEFLTLQPPSAIGFWLRRGIDNTDDECWLGIQKLMNKYDSEWFHRVLTFHGLEGAAG